MRVLRIIRLKLIEKLNIFHAVRTGTESGALNLLIAGERMRILLSLPSKRKAPASVFGYIIFLGKQKDVRSFAIRRISTIREQIY